MSIRKYIRRHLRTLFPQGPASRGFTLVELLAVVAMVGILSAIALVGYRRWLHAARSADAKAVVSAIRIAQENNRAETMSYLNCSTNLTDFYPNTVPNGKKMLWRNSSHSDFGCWSVLNVVTDSPTTFGFAVVAGAPGGLPPAPNTVAKPVWPSPTTEPWYVVQAAGDADNDGTRAYLVSSSFNGEIYIENESE